MGVRNPGRNELLRLEEKTFDAQFRQVLKRQLQRHLDLPGVVQLNRIDTTEIRTSRVRVGAPEARVVEGVESLETELGFYLLQELEVLIEPKIQLVHTAGPDVTPAGRIPAHIIAEILVDAVLDGVIWRRLVVVARQILNAGPGRVVRDVSVPIREANEVRRIEPTVERALVARKREVLAVIE